MRLPFKGTFRLTQVWGVNYETYKRFGLKGHNGVDWGLPAGTPIYAPHSGKVIERLYDANGYGEYVKLENDKWGSILAHFQRKYVVNTGDEVKEGQLVGYSNNSGFSTGPHLHWGLYPKPRNRANGYSGTVDPFKYLNEGDNMTDDWIIKNSDRWIGILTYLEITKESPTLDDAKNVVAGIKSRATDMEKQSGQWEAKYNANEKEVSTLNDQLIIASKANKACNTNLKDNERNLTQAQGQIKGMIEEKKRVDIELAECQTKRDYKILLRIKDWILARYK